MKISETVIVRLQADETDAWADVLDTYYERIVLFCGRYVGEPGDAAAIAHDSFLKAKEKIGSFAENTSFSGWLYTIARNTALDSVRREGRYDRQVKLGLSQTATARMVLQPEADNPGPRTDCHRREMYRTLFSCLEALPDAQAEVIMLRYIDELSRPEIATLLDIPENTVKSRLLHGLRKLREVVPADLFTAD
jgi:RNA polymerase sigma-70 factor (ECF subfamily)